MVAVQEVIVVDVVNELIRSRAYSAWRESSHVVGGVCRSSCCQVEFVEENVFCARPHFHEVEEV